MENGNLIPHQGNVRLFPSFFNASESQDLMSRLVAGCPWKQEPIRMFGKEILQPRLTCWFGDPGSAYSYSGITMAVNEWNPALLEIKERIEPEAGGIFTGALLNLYRDGQDSMGWHRDNEKELGKNPLIASVSFGQTRHFQLRNYQTKKETISLDLVDGSLLIMSGETQHFWEHRIPKQLKLESPRLNITFRIIRQGSK